MNFEDIVLNTFKDEKLPLYLNEGVIPLTPFIAFASMKRKAFNKIKNKLIKYNPKKISKGLKAYGLEAKEKMRAGVGLTTGEGKGATVYKLTPEQVDIMAHIYSKYGKELAKEIIQFRKNVLAPYSLIKRIIKQSSRVSSSDITGMTKEQFLSALESGRKKIQARGEDFFEKTKKSRERINNREEYIKALEQSRKAFLEGKSIDNNIASKVYKEYGAGEGELEGYSAEDMKRFYSKIMRNYKDMVNLSNKISKTGGSEEEFKKAASLRRRSQQLWSGRGIDLTKTESDDFTRKGNFNAALGKYFFRKEIRDKLKPGRSTIFRDTYISIIDKLLEKAKLQKKRSMEEIVSLKKAVEFNDKEKRIWEKRPSVKHFSGKVEDYYQKIKEEDFLDKPIAIQRSPKLKKAEQQIENEVKRFERSLGKTLTAEDLAKLKKYRLINNLISVRELEAPEKLFKSSDEIKAQASKTTGYISADEFVRKIREIATIEYDTMQEFNNAKKEAKELAEKMKAQGDEALVKKNKDILTQIERRRTLERVSLSGHKVERGLLVDIDDIERLIRKMIETEYTSTDKIKQDKQRLDKMVQDYKKTDPEAERNLEEIQFLFNKLDVKLKKGEAL